MTQKDGFDALQKLSWHFASHRVLTVAAKTGILGALQREFRTANQIATELKLDAAAVSKIVGVLTALELVDRHEDTFRLNSMMRPLFAGGNADMAAFLLHSHFMYDGWGENLEDWVRGNPWQRRVRSGEDMAAFGEAMRAIAYHVSKRMLAHLSLEKASRILDVGGGTGMYAQAFCQASKKVEVTVFDTPQTAQLGRRRMEGTPLQGRIRFMGGDFLTDEMGENYDLVLLSNVIHQESPEGARALLQRSVESLAPNGRVVIVEFAIDEQKSDHLMGTLFAVNMRSFGNTYTESQLRQWMEMCDLNDVEQISLDDNRWMFVGRKIA